MSDQAAILSQTIFAHPQAKNQPLVSIAMPVYNAGKYIRATLDSVLNQTYQNFELIIVNDCSTDNSKEIILSYGDPRIHYLENEENLGIAKTRNLCIANASGRYIAVLDNDDIAAADRLEKQVAFLESNPEFGMCGSFWTLIDANGKKIADVKTPTSDSDIKTYLVFNNCFCNSSIMIRNNMLKEFLYPEYFSMIEDYYFLFKNRNKSKLAILPEPLTQYRKHGENTSIGKKENMRALRKKMDSLILRDIGITHSEYQLDLHSSLMNGNYEFFSNSRHLSDLEVWAVKLLKHLARSGQYEMRVAERILVRRWLAMIWNRKKNLNRIFFNKLFRHTGLRYFSYLWETIKDKYAGSIHVI